ncbi:Uncharacterised protein [Vibrio cholerae]|nr:Uncharacterised protein [Vibrio cholerae]
MLKQRPALMTINERKQLSMALFQKCKMFNQPLCALLGWPFHTDIRFQRFFQGAWIVLANRMKRGLIQ